MDALFDHYSRQVQEGDGKETNPTRPESAKGRCVPTRHISLARRASLTLNSDLGSTKVSAKDTSIFQEDHEGSKAATKLLKSKATSLVTMKYNGEPICTPVLVVGKAKGGNALIGAFGIQVWT